MEKNYWKNIQTTKGRKLPLISHWLNTIFDSDAFFTMESLKLIGQGTFEELLSTKRKKKNFYLSFNSYRLKLFYSLSNKIIYFKFFIFNVYLEFGYILKNIK